MHCYRHQTQEAVGICKSCNKGLCSDCAVDIGQGIACKNSCEQDVKDLNGILNQSKKAYANASAAYYRQAIFCGLLGLVFVIYAMVEPGMETFMLPVGIIFLVAMIFAIYTGYSYKSKKTKNNGS